FDAPAAELDAAADAAATLLLGARFPLVYGFERATVEAQRIAVEIADLTGAAIDPASAAAHVLALQWIGQVTATLGEVRSRPDLVIYWGIDPDSAHAGFRARYTTPARGAPPRATFAVDVGEARGPVEVDARFAVRAHDEIEVLWALRTRMRKRRVELLPGEAWLEPRLEELVARLRGSRYVVVFYDACPPPSQRDPMRAFALTALAIDARPITRLRIIGVRRPGNAVGAETVLAWQTGFPRAVSFGHGHPRYGPGEFTAERLLAHGEADVALLVTADPARDLSPAAVAGLERIPTIVIGEDGAWSSRSTRVRFTTPDFDAVTGSVYRMDGVPLRRRAPGVTAADTGGDATRADVPADAAVLGRLAAAIRRCLVASSA
ncbi:MAG: hypothetical protein ACRELX_06700, partial [Longimicrobiales bacterium]